MKKGKLGSSGSSRSERHKFSMHISFMFAPLFVLKRLNATFGRLVLKACRADALVVSRQSLPHAASLYAHK